MEPLSILFVCVGNTCRSPMAEAIARGLGGGEITASSAGLAPYGRIVAATRSAIEALGYEADGLASKGLEAVDLGSFDVIVSLLGAPGLSYLPRTLGAQLIAWEIPDPFGEDDEVYLATARTLERRVRALLADLDDRELPVI